MKKEKGIQFSGEMVKAILEGRKTQTRRIIKPQVAIGYDDSVKSRYQVGDILYVKETWHKSHDEYYYKADTECRFEGKCGYDNDCEADNCGIYVACERENGNLKWKSPMFMPKEAARIFLRVIDVKAERLQDISEADAISEGCRANVKFKAINGNVYNGSATSKEVYAKLWDSIYAKREGGIYAWERNPWVWVYTFERMESEAKNDEQDKNRMV